jgi:hypothetical protein
VTGSALIRGSFAWVAPRARALSTDHALGIASVWSQRVALAGTGRLAAAAGSDKLAPLRSRRPEIDHLISTPVLPSFLGRNAARTFL